MWSKKLIICGVLFKVKTWAQWFLMRDPEMSPSLNASLYLATSIQNDLNRGSPGAQSTSSRGQATWSLEEEKSRLLAEAAVELRQEDTRQERILALAKRLAVLQGRNPDKGKGWQNSPSLMSLGQAPRLPPPGQALHSGCTLCQAESIEHCLEP